MRSFACGGVGLSRLDPSPSEGVQDPNCSQWRIMDLLYGGWDGRTLSLGHWYLDGCIRPVLKHGPRSAILCMQVHGWKTCQHNESEGRCFGLLW